MKIAITASGKDLDSAVNPRFGRADGFIIFDTETEDFEYVDNAQNVQAAQGAGIQASRTIVNSGAKAVITGHCGPKAFSTLNAAGVKIFTGADGTVKEAIEKFKAGNLKEAGGSDVGGHWM